MSIDPIDQMPPTSDELDRASLDAAIAGHPASWDGPRSRIYDTADGSQVLVTDYADGSQSVASRPNQWASWGPPTMWSGEPT